MNYEPNVLPLPVGGYYWVSSTSRRTYGTRSPPGLAPRGEDIWGALGSEPRKKLWLAAIDIDHPGKSRPKHPPLTSRARSSSRPICAASSARTLPARGTTCESAPTRRRVLSRDGTFGRRRADAEVRPLR